MKLLIVEDEEDLAMGLKRGLRKNGYDVEWSSDGREGLELALIEDYECLLLDLNLPGMDGLELLHQLRQKKPQQKVLILSARGAVHDKVKGLDLGADDYLVKPFHFEELLARIRNLTGRRFVRQEAVVWRGKLRIDIERHQVFAQDQRLKLTAKEIQILETLALNEGRLLSAEAIIAQVWSEDEDLFSNAFKVHLSSLRRKLTLATGEDWIECQRGLGYRLKENDHEKA
ncbi:response regulator transcription factor [Holdemania massiliensis]|uniref:response regulator transcription factor n=1 Tax=Holdemania massiliensis TaxID=1468449 RepID=UPI001F069029|nr:response regulator transcription factor [Holdemania massiliensis]MCH1939555.1 response regulator transcription factor [Holdemania massiliensis]